MQYLRTKTLWAVAVVLVLQTGLPGQEPSGDRADVLFLVELAESEESSDKPSLVMDVVFYGTEPDPNQVEGVLRSSLHAGIALYVDRDIAAHAWWRATPTSVQRRALPLGNGADGLRYVSADRSVKDGPGGTPTPAPATGADNDYLSTVVGDAKVVDACDGLEGADATTLAGIALEKHGEERAIVVKAMRDYRKANDIPLDRALRVCMSAISKAVTAIEVAPTMSPEERTEAIARGKTAYEARGCMKCHLSTGVGGPRGPDLTDSTWDHCDGSVESIADVILSGVPRSKLKDTNRPFGMNPASDLSRGDSVLTDLAVYVHSLSQ